MTLSMPSLLQTVLPHAAREEGLVLKPGQSLAAVVAAISAEGIATLQLTEGTITARLPEAVTVGSTLQLLVKTGGTAPQLSLVTAIAPDAPQVAAAPPPVVQMNEALVQAVATIRTSAAAGGINPTASFSPSLTAVMPPGTAPLSARALGATSATVQVLAPASGSPATMQSGVMTSAGRPTAVQMAPPPPANASASVQGLSTVAGTPITPPTSAVSQVAAIPVESIAIAAGARPAAGGPSGIAATPALLPQDPTAVPVPSLSQTPSDGSADPVTNAPVPSAPTSLAVPRSVPYAAEMRRLPETTAPLVAPPTTPAAALARAVPTALAVQNSLGPLLQTLAAVSAGPVRLPPALQQIVRQILAQRINAGTGSIALPDIERAMTNAGTMFEARLATGGSVAGDLKGLLLTLRSLLAPLAKVAGPLPPPPGPNAPPPPLRDLPPRAGEPATPLPLPNDPPEVAKLVTHQVDGALARMRLAQAASLPDADPRQPAAGLRLELPILAGTELVMAQMHVTPEGRQGRREHKRGWSVKFAMNFREAGEVGAEIGIFDRTIDVGLWAMDEELASRMRELLPDLSAAIADGGLQPGRLRVRSGAPAVSPQAGGRMVDRGT